MNQSDIFRRAYALFQETDNAPSDADIIMVLHSALETAFCQGYEEGRRAEAEQQAAAEAEYAEAVDIGEQLLYDLDTFFSDDMDRVNGVDHFGSDLTIDEVEEARGPVGNAYDHSEGHDFTVSSNGDTVSVRLVPRYAASHGQSAAGSTRQYPDGPAV